MKPFVTRIVGAVLIVTAIAGLLASLIGLVTLWRLKASWTEQLIGMVELSSNTLDTTAEGLEVARQSLVTSITSVSALEDTILATGKTIDETAPLVNTLVTLTKDDLPTTVATVQTSLTAAQESARLIDSVLKALSNIPFVNLNYNPPVPLNVALEQVSASMDGLPGSLKTMEQSLTITRDNLRTIQGDIHFMADDVRNIKSSLENAKGVVERYQALVADLQTRAERTKNRLPGQINLLAWGLTFILVWVSIAQLGLFMQGWELLHRP